MSRALRALSLAACLFTLGMVRPVHAEAANPPGYDAAIDEALEAFEHGEFERAREMFLRAHKIFPSARTLRALGKSEFELKQFADAASHLSLALGSQVRPLTPSQRTETELLLRRSEGSLARYTFELHPPHAELRIDGAPAVLDSEHALRLSAGDHVLEASAEGYRPWRRDVVVLGRVDEVIALELTPLVVEPVVRAPVREQPSAPLVELGSEPGPREDAPTRSKKWILWTTLGAVVVAGAITGAVLATRDRGGDARASGGSTGLVIELGGGN